MTIVNDDATGTMSVDTAGEGDPSNDNWDPGSYLDAVRKDLASAFAPAPSLPPAFQGTTPSTKPLRIQETPSSTPRRTPIHGRPIILRDLHKHSSSLLTQEETSRLLRSLTQRDMSILQALHDYRYLNEEELLDLERVAVPLRSRAHLPLVDDQSARSHPPAFTASSDTPRGAAAGRVSRAFPLVLYPPGQRRPRPLLARQPRSGGQRVLRGSGSGRSDAGGPGIVALDWSGEQPQRPARLGQGTSPTDRHS